MASRKTAKQSKTASSQAPAKSAPNTEPEVKAEAATAEKVADNTIDNLTEEKKPEAAKAPIKESKAKTSRSSGKKTTTGKAPASSSGNNKTTPKKASAPSKAGVSQKTYFEIAGEQILMEDINERIRQAWLAEGHYPSRLKTIKTYLNIEERRAYYVINGKAENKFVEF